MVFEGDLKTLSLPQVLQLIGAGKYTGTLYIMTGRLTHSLYFNTGRITIYNPGSRIPFDIATELSKWGEISRNLARFIAKKAKSTGRTLGNHLVATGAVSKEKIANAVLESAKDDLFTLFLTKIGEYKFEADQYPREIVDRHQEEFPFSIDPNDLLLESLRRQEKWKHFEESLPNPEIVLECPVKNKDEWKKLDVPTGHTEELVHVNGRNSVYEMMEKTPLTSFELYELLCAALDRQIIIFPRKNLMAELGEKAAREGDAPEAVKFFRNALWVDEKDHLIRLRYARNLVQLGLRADAVEQLLLLGDQFDEAGTPDFAETFYTEAHEILPEHPEAGRRLKILREKAGETAAPPEEAPATTTEEKPAVPAEEDIKEKEVEKEMEDGLAETDDKKADEEDIDDEISRYARSEELIAPPPKDKWTDSHIFLPKKAGKKTKGKTRKKPKKKTVAKKTRSKPKGKGKTVKKKPKDKKK